MATLLFNILRCTGQFVEEEAICMEILGGDLGIYLNCKIESETPHLYSQEKFNT